MDANDDFLADLLATDDDVVSDEMLAIQAEAAAERAAFRALLGEVTIPADRKPCGRCGGEGRIACYAHIAQGVCFSCGGRGY